MRVPSRINLGLAVVRIKQVSVRDMRLEAECEDDDPTPDGLWDADGDVILVLRKLSSRRKGEVLLHEIQHAVIDAEYWRRHGVQ